MRNLRDALNSTKDFIIENRYPILMMAMTLSVIQQAQASETIYCPGDTCEAEAEIFTRDECGAMCKYYMDNLQWMASHGNAIATNVLEYCATTGFNIFTQSVRSDCMPNNPDADDSMNFALGLIIPRECRNS